MIDNVTLLMAQNNSIEVGTCFLLSVYQFSFNSTCFWKNIPIFDLKLWKSSKRNPCVEFKILCSRRWAFRDIFLSQFSSRFCLPNLISKVNEAFNYSTVDTARFMNNKSQNRKPFKCFEANSTGPEAFESQQSKLLHKWPTIRRETLRFDLD